MNSTSNNMFSNYKTKKFINMFTSFIINRSSLSNNDDTVCDSLANPTENFKFSLLYLFPYYLQIVQEILKTARGCYQTRSVQVTVTTPEYGIIT